MCWETKAAVAQGLLSVVGAPQTDRKGRLYTMFRDLSPLGRAHQSVRGPLCGPRGQGPRQSDKTQQRPPSLRARWLCKNARRGTVEKLCYISFITWWNRAQWQEEKKNRKKGKISVKLLQVPPSKNICRGREDRKKKKTVREKEEKRNRPFTTLKRKRLWSEREKIFTQGISSGSLCACRALVTWLHFKAQVAQLELPPGQA